MRVVRPHHVGTTATSSCQDHAEGPERHIGSVVDDDCVDLERSHGSRRLPNVRIITHVESELVVSGLYTPPG